MRAKIARALGSAGISMAAAAGAYYLYGSENAARHRRKVGAWMRRAEREIVHEAKRLKGKTYTDKNIQRVINEVAKRYKVARDLDPKDVKQFVNAVHKSWKDAGMVVKNRITTSMKTKSTPKRARTAKKRTKRS